jgi:biopolymer transport protein ExbB
VNRFVFLYEKTGVCGVALLLLALVSLYLFLKNSLYLRWVYRDFKLFFGKVESGKLPITSSGTSTSNPLVGIIQGVADSHATHSRDLRAEVAYLFHKHFQRVTGGLTALRLISVISPLLGLMGTVLGMVKVFKVIAVQTNADPSVMAEGIWEAMLTTIMGLTVAIPTLIFFYFLRLKLNGFQIEAVEYGYRTLGIIHPDCPYGKRKKYLSIDPCQEENKRKQGTAIGTLEAS